MDENIWIWIDGVVLPAAQARVPVLDRGFLYGDSVFEVTRTVNGVPLFLKAHLERLEKSAAAVGCGVPERWQIEQAVQATSACVPASEYYLRIIVTRGAGPLDLDPATAWTPRLIVIAKPLRLPELRQYQDGVRIVSVGEELGAAGRSLPAIKSSNYLLSILALKTARQHGGYEALLCDREGYISEGASSNFFIVVGSEIRTPPLSQGLLAGVTRAAVADLARAAGLKIAEAGLRLSEAKAADEAFLTSSIRGVLPVCYLDGQAIGKGQPGAVTRLLMERYREDYLAGPQTSPRESAVQSR